MVMCLMFKNYVFEIHLYEKYVFKRSDEGKKKYKLYLKRN